MEAVSGVQIRSGFAYILVTIHPCGKNGGIVGENVKWEIELAENPLIIKTETAIFISHLAFPI